MEMRMKTSNVVRMLQMMSARLREGKTLFDPIKINITPRKEKFNAVTMMVNRNGTAYAIARFSDIPVTGLDKEVGTICVSADTLISYFEECYGSDETLLIEAEDGGVTARIVNEDADYPTEIFHPQVSEEDGNLRSLDEFPFKLKDGIPFYKEGTIKPDTEVTIDASEIHKAIKHKSRVAKHAMGGRSPKYYKFIFGDKESFVIIGDPDDLTMSPIKKQLNCEVDGPGATFMVGDEDLEHVMGIISGVVTIYCKTDYPIWITQKGEDYGVGYLVAPKAEEEEVDVEVTDEGDVEIVNVEDDEVEDEVEAEDLDISDDPEDAKPEDSDTNTTDPTEDVETEEESKEETKDESEDESDIDVVIEDETDLGEDSDDDIPVPKEEVQEETSGDEDDLTDLDLEIS